MQDRRDPYSDLHQALFDNPSHIDNNIALFLQQRKTEEPDRIKHLLETNEAFFLFEHMVIQRCLKKILNDDTICLNNNEEVARQMTLDLFIKLKKFFRTYPQKVAYARRYHQALVLLKDHAILSHYFYFLSELSSEQLKNKETAHKVADIIESDIELKQKDKKENKSNFLSKMIHHSGKISGSASGLFGGMGVGMIVGFVAGVMLAPVTGGISMIAGPFIGAAVTGLPGLLAGYLVGDVVDKKLTVAKPEIVAKHQPMPSQLHFLYSKYTNYAGKKTETRMTTNNTIQLENAGVPVSLHDEIRGEKQHQPSVP